MFNQRTIFVILYVLFIYSCSETSTNLTDTFTVKGVVMSAGLPVENATISIDSMYNYTTTSNSNGSFEIKDVSKGDHQLKMEKKNSDNSFTQQTIDIGVYSDVVLNNLILPKPVRLYDSVSVEENTITIRWSPSDAEDFREYKLYRHTSAGIDENTGTFIYVSIDRNDTSFTDIDLSPSKAFFYRIFMMNEYGKLGGSNVVSGTTEIPEVIINGSFENVDQYLKIPVNWQRSGGIQEDNSIISDSSESYDGQYSVHARMNHIGDLVLTQTIDAQRINPAKSYKATFWMKIDSLLTGEMIVVGITENGGVLMIFGPLASSDWREFSFDISFIETINPQNYGFFFDISCEGSSTSYHNLDIWIDNLAVTEVE